MSINLKTGQRTENMKWRIKGISSLLQNRDRLLPTPWREHAFLTAPGFIEKVVSGILPAYDTEQANYYRSLCKNSDGTCGQRVHRKMCAKVK
jgi:hypothetical protein